MSISEQARHQLHTRLEQLLGTDEAATLIAYLPPVGWHDVATKRDLDAAVSTLRGEFHRELGELRGEFGQLRGEFGQLRGEFGELRGEFGAMRGELKAEIRTQTRSLFLSLVGLQLTGAGLAIAVSRLA